MLTGLIGCAFSGISKVTVLNCSTLFLHRRINAMKTFSSKIGALAMVGSLAFLPSCQWLKDKLGITNQQTTIMADQEAGSGEKALASAGGKTLITVPEFQKQFKNLIETHPYGDMLAQMEGLERKFLEGLVSQKLMTRYVIEKGIRDTEEYKKQLEQMTQMLDMRFYQMQHQPKVTESEMRAFFDQNKENIPEAAVSRGGVPVTAVSFSTEADAKAFLEKAKGKGAQMEQVAKDEKLADKFRDFKVVNANSIGIDPVLRDKVVTFKKLPTLELVKVNDNSYFVVYAGPKEEAKYRSFDELKGSIEQRLTAKKQEEELEKAVEKLKKDYDVVIDEEYFAKKDGKAGQEEIGEEQLEMVMPEAPAQEAHAKPTARAA